jgi:hypothetical protein
MTTITPGPAPVPGPVLTAAPWAGRLIGLVFVVTVVLFLVAVLTL